MATVVESALCALRNCVAFMPPGKAGVWYMLLWWEFCGWEFCSWEPGAGPDSLLSHDSGTEPGPAGPARASGVGQQVG